MMFGVSGPYRDDHAYSHDPQPTMPLPQVGPGRSRHAAQQPTPWLWWLIGAGAIVTVLLGLLAAFFIAGGGPDRPAAEPAPAQTATISDESSAPVASDEPSPSASPSPSPRRTSPTAVLARLASTITSLESSGQLDQDAADELGQPLDEARRALAEGDVDKARDELSNFATKVQRLHKKDELSDSAYQTLASLMTQLAQVLPKP